MHGGLSPDLNSMEQIRRVMRPTDVSKISFWRLFHLGINRSWKGAAPLLLTDLDT